MLMMWLWRWWGLWYLLETLNHNFHDRMVSCAMGPGDVDIFSKPFRKPDDRMVNDSITSALLLDSFTTLHAVMYLQQHHYIMLALSHYIIVSLFRCILTESPRCCWILHVLLQKNMFFSEVVSCGEPVCSPRQAAREIHAPRRSMRLKSMYSIPGHPSQMSAQIRSQSLKFQGQKGCCSNSIKINVVKTINNHPPNHHKWVL